MHRSVFHCGLFLFFKKLEGGRGCGEREREAGTRATNTEEIGREIQQKTEKDKQTEMGTETEWEREGEEEADRYIKPIIIPPEE